MTSPLRMCVSDLRACAHTVCGYRDPELRKVGDQLNRIANMLEPLGLGKFWLIENDGSINRVDRVPNAPNPPLRAA